MTKNRSDGYQMICQLITIYRSPKHCVLIYVFAAPT